MPLRRLAAWAFVMAALLAVAILGFEGWWIHRLMDAGTDVAVWKLGGLALASIAVVIGAVGFGLDRILVARESDHRSLPARPEFFDFDEMNQPMHIKEMGGQRLKDLSFVVFDTETTGLRPSAGDEMISIAGVRIENGEVETATAFTRLVNPGRTIPKSSIKFHGITDDMVAGEAPLRDVLPGFKDFIGDAVLVAHNADFDMKFLSLKEVATGICIDNLVLDTLFLSLFLEHGSQNHSFDAIAERLGIDIEGRHTALGDAIATARVFLRMVEMLEARGVTTLRQAIESARHLEHVRRMAEQF
ncbi:MAG: hypothetical protein HOA30_01885 [Rhodospirillaceae bacterium]|nr:hypothetical protein [Rhodospirillaceae bacterium]